MKCDSRASLLVHTLTSPCLGREPKARVATYEVRTIKVYVAFAYPLKKFVCEPCVNIANVLRHDNKTCVSHKTFEVHILILHI
jgi:hypothetical protein